MRAWKVEGTEVGSQRSARKEAVKRARACKNHDV